MILKIMLGISFMVIMVAIGLIILAHINTFIAMGFKNGLKFLYNSQSNKKVDKNV